MQNKHQRIKTLFLGLFVSVSLVACGGGGSTKPTTETDTDGDGVINTEDAFPNDANESVDTDGDGTGNNADTDDDGDGVADADDVFPLDANETVDTDGDGTGDNADTDDDGDGVADTADAFPLNASETVDTDGDGTGNNADNDDDGDGIADNIDPFPLVADETVDTDGDGIKDNVDTDDDNDGVADAADAFPLDATETVDTDGDGTGNNADTDDDGDGVADASDAFPLDATETVDTDSNGTGNNADTDDDGDGVADASDAFPLDATETVDTDGDGTGDNADTDDDDDGISDADEIAAGTDPLDATDFPDTTNPMVSSTTPSNNSTNVSRDSNVTATFNEDMFATTIGIVSFTLKDALNQLVPSSVSFNAANNVASLDPNAKLALLSTFSATLNSIISDLSGNTLPSTTWNFTTADGAWQAQTSIGPNNAEPQSFPEIAIDGQGNAIAVWQEKNAMTNAFKDIYANRYTAASDSWGAPIKLNTVDTDEPGIPEIAMDSAGNAIAIWKDNGSDVKAARYTASTNSWADPVDIQVMGATGNAFPPIIQMDNAGNALAVWRQLNNAGDQYQAMSNSYSASGWSGAVRVTNTASDQREADHRSLSLDKASGKAMLVFSIMDFSLASPTRNLWASLYTPASGWGDEILIENDNSYAFTQAIEYPLVGVDASGNFTAAWKQRIDHNNNGSATSEIWSNRYNSSTSSWATASKISLNNVGEYTDLPALDVHASGKVLVVWQQESPANDEFIWSTLYTPGSGWNTPVNIQTGTNESDYSKVAFDTAGNALAVWRQEDASNDDKIHANRYNAGTASWESAQQIQTSNDEGFRPQIVINSKGEAIAVWYEDTGTPIQSSSFK